MKNAFCLRHIMPIQDINAIRRTSIAMKIVVRVIFIAMAIVSNVLLANFHTKINVLTNLIALRNLFSFEKLDVLTVHPIVINARMLTLAQNVLKDINYSKVVVLALVHQ